MNPQKGEVPPAERKAFTKARPEPYRTMKQVQAREDARRALDGEVSVSLKPGNLFYANGEWTKL